MNLRNKQIMKQYTLTLLVDEAQLRQAYTSNQSIKILVVTKL